jgi:hypothetical protein
MPHEAAAVSWLATASSRMTAAATRSVPLSPDPVA